MLHKLIKINGEQYILNKTVPEQTTPDIEERKKLTNSDIAFKKQGMIYFCSTIEDVEILEELSNKKEAKCVTKS